MASSTESTHEHTTSDRGSQSSGDSLDKPLDQFDHSKEQDLERGQSPAALAFSASQDPDLVTWDGPDDPENPKNWPNKTKWCYTVTVSLFAVISPISSSMIAPALETLGRDLNMNTHFEVNLSLSIFVLAFAVGPFFLGPASELMGRVRLLQLGNLWYLAWNLGCGFSNHKAQMFVFRFLAGVGGSAPLAAGGGALSDVWIPEQRGKAMGIYTLAPILGPVIGPIAGSWIAEKSTWRWVFWSTSAFAVAIQVAGLIWLRESYAPVLLKRKCERLIKETGNKSLHVDNSQKKSLIATVTVAMVRPARMITTQPIVFIIALYMAYLFGTTYLFLATFPGVWVNWYGEGLGISGLNYLSLAIGCFTGLILNLKYIDRIYRTLKEKNNGVGKPEYRMPTMCIGSFFITIGLFWYGWSVQARLHWIMPDIGVLLFGTGTMPCMQAMMTYTVDSYQTYAASALAAVAVLRSLAGFGFPLFAPYLYQALGYGWGTSVLAFISIAIGIPAPFLFWFYGEKLRSVSKFASG